MKVLKITLTVATAVFFSFACAGNTPVATDKVAGNANKPAASTPAPSATAAVKDEMAVAADLYTVNCMTCHKDSGKGGPVTVDGKKIDPDDITTAKMAEKSDDKLKSYIADGFPDDGMPAFKDKLSDAEMVSLVKHVRKLQGK
ncbi:MAG: cytochrome c [Pyrinomonadaceae bacterium]